MTDPEDTAAVLQRIEQRLEGIEAALRRLDEGSYQTCEQCGGAIADADLEVDPARRLCLSCRAQSPGS
ncbi:MAG TPA: TraR/DksA C4-type zinc finger protein [Acidimicrobiales bacterium]|nr:TraR/DksA C4-type zinc finger protein [Acidimicrobiales bacterium]